MLHGTLYEQQFKGETVSNKDRYFEEFQNITAERGWNEDQTYFVGHVAVTALGSSERLLKIAKNIFEIEDGIRAEAEDAIDNFERVFNKDQFTKTQQYRDAGAYQQPTLGYDSEGDYHRPNGWDVT